MNYYYSDWSAILPSTKYQILHKLYLYAMLDFQRHIHIYRERRASYSTNLISRIAEHVLSFLSLWNHFIRLLLKWIILTCRYV